MSRDAVDVGSMSVAPGKFWKGSWEFHKDFVVEFARLIKKEEELEEMVYRYRGEFEVGNIYIFSPGHARLSIESVVYDRHLNHYVQTSTFSGYIKKPLNKMEIRILDRCFLKCKFLFYWGKYA